VIEAGQRMERARGEAHARAMSWVRLGQRGQQQRAARPHSNI
jgi:hypothetical protein